MTQHVCWSGGGGGMAGSAESSFWPWEGSVFKVLQLVFLVRFPADLAPTVSICFCTAVFMLQPQSCDWQGSGVGVR